MPPPVTAASLSTADAGYIENDDEPWHSTCVSKAPVITKGAFDQAYVSSLPFVAPEEALQLAMSSPTLKLKDIDGAIAKCIADGGRKGCPAIVAAEKIKKAADKDGNVKPGKAPGGPAQAAGWDAMKREVDETLKQASFCEQCCDTLDERLAARAGEIDEVLSGRSASRLMAPKKPRLDESTCPVCRLMPFTFTFHARYSLSLWGAEREKRRG